MSLARALLALACAVPLIAADIKMDKCVSKDKHFIIGVPINPLPKILPSVNISPFVRNALEYIPDMCAFSGHRLSKVTITVCDFDVVPELEIDYPLIKVTRKGMLLTEAVIMGKQHCTMY